METILEAGRLIAIVRFRRGGDLTGTIDALFDGGIPIVEVTLDTPGALEAIARAAEAGRRMGAGTVLDPAGVRAAADAGAAFVVSPGLAADVVTTALELGVEPIPGVLSPTELTRALGLGAVAVKVFPAGPVGGPDYIRALRGPFPDARLVPTGGVAVGDVAAYLEAGAAAVGLGATLVGPEPRRSTADLDALRDRAAEAVGIERTVPWHRT